MATKAAVRITIGPGGTPPKKSSSGGGIVIDDPRFSKDTTVAQAQAQLAAASQQSNGFSGKVEESFKGTPQSTKFFVRGRQVAETRAGEDTFRTNLQEKERARIVFENQQKKEQFEISSRRFSSQQQDKVYSDNLKRPTREELIRENPQGIILVKRNELGNVQVQEGEGQATARERSLEYTRREFFPSSPTEQVFSLSASESNLIRFKNPATSSANYINDVGKSILFNKPTSQDTANQVYATVLGAIPQARIPTAIYITGRAVSKASASEEAALTSIIKGKVNRVGSFRINTEISPPRIKYTRTNQGGFLNPTVKYLPSKVTSTITPFKTINQQSYLSATTYKGTVVKIEKITPIESDFISPTLKKEFFQLPKTNQFLLKKIAEERIGGPVRMKDVPDLLARDRKYVRGFLEIKDIGRFYPKGTSIVLNGRIVNTKILPPRTRVGKRTKKFLTISEVKTDFATNNFERLKVNTLYKDVTRPGKIYSKDSIKKLPSSYLKSPLFPSYKKSNSIRIKPSDYLDILQKEGKFDVKYVDFRISLKGQYFVKSKYASPFTKEKIQLNELFLKGKVEGYKRLPSGYKSRFSNKAKEVTIAHELTHYKTPRFILKDYKILPYGYRPSEFFARIGGKVYSKIGIKVNKNQIPTEIRDAYPSSKTKTPQLKQVVVEKIDPVVFSNKNDINVIPPSNTIRTPMSNTFNEQILKQVMKSVGTKPVPRSPTRATTKVVNSKGNIQYGVSASSVSTFAGKGLYERTEGAITPKVSVSNSLKVNQGVFSLSSPRVTTKFQTKMESKSFQLPKTIFKEQLVPREVVISKEVTKTTQKQSQKTVQKQLLKNVLKTSFKPMFRIGRTKPPQIPKTPRGLLPKSNTRSFGSGKFLVSLRRFGKFKPIGIFGSQKQAFLVGKQKAFSTLGATFKVEGFGVKQPSKIRGFKTKQTKQGTLFIQVPKLRLSTSGEKGEINFYRNLRRNR